MLDVSCLSEIDLFRQLPDSCLEALEKDSNVLNCSPGNLFFQPEQTGRVLFVLKKGSVRSFRTCGDRTLTITVLQPPTIFRVNRLLWPGKVLCLRRSSRGFAGSNDLARRYPSSSRMRSSRGTQAGRPDERTIEELSPQDGNACSQGLSRNIDVRKSGERRSGWHGS